MTEIEWWEFDELDDLADAVAGDVAFIIESALDARGQAMLALPGGAFARSIYPSLVEKTINWKKVVIVPTDDRLVALDDPLSNVAGIARLFLPLGARVVPLNSDAADYRLAGSAANARLADLPWPPDLVWLEAGDDGETAGLLPGPDLDGALTADNDIRMIGVMPDPMPADAPVARFTLTAPAIAKARTVLITAAGAKARKILEAAETGQGVSPVARLLGALNLAVDVYWLDT